MWRERQLSQYPVFGVNFAPEGGNMEFVRGQTNAQYFARRSSQLGWSLRLRAVRTKRLMEGEDIDLSTCLVITPAIEGLERFLAQLSQPEFDETSTGKVEIPTSTTCAGIRLTGAMLPWLRTWPWWWALCATLKDLGSTYRNASVDRSALDHAARVWRQYAGPGRFGPGHRV